MPAVKAADPNRARDRDATQRTILAAAKAVLAEEGFQAWGVNAIARRAGCDKQLIYRYFGGLDGLAEAIGANLAADLARELSAHSAPPAPATYGALMRRLAGGLIDVMRANKLMLQINAWESAAPSPLVAKMTLARSKAMGMWMHQMRGSLAPPAGIDAPAINAIIIAALQQLTLSSSASGVFSGLPLKSEEDWTRTRAAIDAMITAIYGA